MIRKFKGKKMISFDASPAVWRAWILVIVLCLPVLTLGCFFLKGLWRSCCCFSGRGKRKEREEEGYEMSSVKKMETWGTH